MSIQLVLLICIIVILVIISVGLCLLFFFKLTKNKKQQPFKKNNNNLKFDNNQTFNQSKKQIDQFLDEYYQTKKAHLDEKLKELIVDILERISKPIIQEKTITNIKIPDDNLKSKIIGKDGRNKKTIENLTGTDLIIEKDENLITISSTSTRRREIAYRLLTKLFTIKSIDSSKIQNLYEQELNNFENESINFTKDLINKELNLSFDNNEIYHYLARMYYRSSYGQNSLIHIIECAKIAGAIAEQLQLNQQKAIKCALFHDIGKSLDYELDKNHVELGIEIAKKLNFDNDIINAIAAHHDEINCDNIYSQITKIADGISASRPGARINSYNEYFERVNELEKVVNSFSEVNSSYVIRSGRNLRVIVNPIKIKDNKGLELLAIRIKNKLETNELIKKYKIKVTLIKENKYEFETSIKS